MPTTASIARLRVAALALLGLAPLAHASLWESNDWALTSVLNGSAGYDSNLTVRKDGPGDSFVTIAPYLTFLRRNSSTDFRFNANFAHTEFLHNRQPRQTDLKFDVIYAYPNADNVIPVYRLEASWLKAAQPNQYLGQRIPTKQLSLEAEGFLPLTGKLGLRGSTAFETYDYDFLQLNHSQRVEAFLGLALARNKRTEFSLNLGGAAGRSEPNDPASTTQEVRSRELILTTKMRGELTAKLVGSIFAGIERVKYTGGLVKTTSLPVGGADLTWKVDPLRSLVLTASSGVNFAPDGQTVEQSRISLRFTHAIIEQWQYTLRAGTTHSSYSRIVQERADESWDLGAEFAYIPSRFFRLFLGVNYTNQNSDSAFGDFDRNVITLGVSYRP